MKFKSTGKSIKELLKIYGTGSAGFYDTDWYKKEKFFTEKPKAGEYEIDLGEDLVNLNYDEQVAKLKTGFSPIHPATLCELILSHYKETGERLFENKWARTSAIGSDGVRVDVGFFGVGGLRVDRWWGDDRDDGIGLSSARKLDNGALETPESLTLENAIEIVKQAGFIIYNPM